MSSGKGLPSGLGLNVLNVTQAKQIHRASRGYLIPSYNYNAKLGQYHKISFGMNNSSNVVVDVFSISNINNWKWELSKIVDSILQTFQET